IMPNKKILVVEDEALVSMEIQDRLRGLGYSIAGVAYTGEDAVKLAEETLPDLILMDINLGGEMTGIEAARQIRADIDIPIIFLTAYADEATFQTAHATDPFGYILKPFKEKELYITIEMALYKHKLESELKETNLKLELEIAERKKAETQLRVLSEMIKQSTVAIMRMDIHFRITYMNEAAKQLFGWNLEELQGKFLNFLNADPMGNEITRQIYSTVRSGKAYFGENIAYQKGGTTFYCQHKISPLFDNDGKISGYMATGKDITESKIAQETLNESEEKYRTLVESIEEGIGKIDAEKYFTFVNNTACKIFGYPEEELLGMNLQNLVSEEDYQRILEESSFRKRGEVSRYEIAITRKDGRQRIIMITASPIFDSDKNYEGAFAIFRDITELKKSEAQIRKLSQAVEQSSASIVITDTEGTIEYVNPAFTRVTGYTLKEAIGQNPRILKPKDKPSGDYKELWDTLTAGKIWQGEFRNLKKNGEYYWELVSISPIINKDGKITHYVGVKEDITQQKQMEEDLRESNDALEKAVATKDKFFSIIAHDIKNAFNSILLATEFLAEDAVNININSVQKMSKSLNTSAQNAYKLLENLLTWSRLQRGMIEIKPKKEKLLYLASFNLGLFSETATGKNITLINSVPDIYVFADYAAIDTVVRNLVNNALKFTKPGGNVEISAIERG
ncbi:MAG TPA: PAS domain S-box protein, partial [Bacteroidetes bacterium]|nr:PAS domain S-box protein [Bacteroidota bacterium]